MKKISIHPVNYLALCLLVLSSLAVLHSEEKAEEKVALYWFEGISQPASIEDQMLLGLTSVALEKLHLDCLIPADIDADIKESGKKGKDGKVLDDSQLIELLGQKRPSCLLLVRSEVKNAVFEKYKSPDEDPLLPLVHYRFQADYVYRIIEIKTSKVVENLTGSCSAQGFLSLDENTEANRDILMTALQQKSLADASTQITRMVASILEVKTLLIVEQVQEKDIVASLQRGEIPKSGETFTIYELRMQTTKDGQVEEVRTVTGRALVYRTEGKQVFLKILVGTAKKGYVLVQEEQ